MEHDAEKLKQHVDDAQKLVEALEIAKVAVPPVIKQILNALSEGAELSMSAEEASQHFAKFIKDMDKQCGKDNPDMEKNDAAFICLAKRERTEGSLGYAGRVNFVLNPNNPFSMISIHWSKKKREGWACVWDELRTGSSGIYRKCFIPKGEPGHIPRAP